MRNKEKGTRINLKYIFSLFISTLIIISLSRMIWGNLEGLRRVRNLRSEVQALRGRNEELKREIARREKLEYVEEQARRELGMVKEGEKVFIYPGKQQEDNDNERNSDYLEGDLCYWCEWLKAFGF